MTNRKALTKIGLFIYNEMRFCCYWFFGWHFLCFKISYIQTLNNFLKSKFKKKMLIKLNVKPHELKLKLYLLDYNCCLWKPFTSKGLCSNLQPTRRLIPKILALISLQPSAFSFRMNLQACSSRLERSRPTESVSKTERELRSKIIERAWHKKSRGLDTMWAYFYWKENRLVWADTVS